MKTTILILPRVIVLILISTVTQLNNLYSQKLVWEKSHGSIWFDQAEYSIEETNDGGYIFPMLSYREFVPDPYCRYCPTITKTDTAGNIIWKKRDEYYLNKKQHLLGGKTDMRITSVQPTLDGGYITAGYANGMDPEYGVRPGASRDINRNHAWVMKLNSLGVVEWGEIYWGDSEDYGFSAKEITKIDPISGVPVSDGFIIGGYTYSTSGDVKSNHGKTDIWVLRLDTKGGIVWSQTYGGSSEEQCTRVQPTRDGGFIALGKTYSNDHDATGNHGKSDIIVLKLKSNGDIDWKKTYGGSNEDYPGGIEENIDGNGYIFSGTTTSIDGNIISKRSGSTDGDIWVVKLKANGNIIWDKTYGGTADEMAWDIAIKSSDTTYMISGSAGSNDLDVFIKRGLHDDYYALKLDKNGNFKWSSTYGGGKSDFATSIRPTKDGNYYIGIGTTFSWDGDITGSIGEHDAWMIKIKDTDVKPTILISPTIFYGNEMNLLRIDVLDSRYIGATVEIIDMVTSAVKIRTTITKTKEIIDITSLPRGIYLVRITGPTTIQVRIVVI